MLGFLKSRVAALSTKVTITPSIDPMAIATAKAAAISWYPGHIAKAERELADYLKKVDVVIEVRDARIPLATTHPMVPEWVGNKPLIVAIARIDQISKKALTDWKEYYAYNPAHPNRPDTKVYFVDGKLGAGVITMKKQAMKASGSINDKRMRRGIQPRPVRAAVIGFPNVGKSALINRLLGRKMAKSKNLPGVTRSLQWVRLGGSEFSGPDSIELLDSPGIIPAKQIDQKNAMLLAICNDIGEASYDRVLAAAAVCDKLNEVYACQPKYINMQLIIDRYKMPFDKYTGEEIVYEVANKVYNGNSISAADKILGDFRKGLLGAVSLEVPPKYEKSEIDGPGGGSIRRHIEEDEDEEESEEQTGESGRISPSGGAASDTKESLDIGKGNYDGW